ncbi:MAG: AraC family transcriptional regulator [Defluviitaleaceae bacterium]|nr:AraC family transcriptional regulator [Defluviitaleaceae bacterium]
MHWIQGLTNAIDYIEANLTEDFRVEDVACRAYSSSSHFQLIFHLTMGLTVGDYVRNRRLSLAAQDLLRHNGKIVDIAARYRYETPESFSKAFARFHGVPPSRLRNENARFFHPFTINLSIRGGFELSRKPYEMFHFVDWGEIEGLGGDAAPDAEKYARVVDWAGRARGQNPNVFDALTEWILDDSEWTAERLAENEQILMRGVLARFKEQNARLRSYLKKLEPSGVVNAPVFNALDRFDEELSGRTRVEELAEAVTKVFSDFRSMSDRNIRERIAGNKTGPHGVNGVELFGYVNHLKDCDAGVQWALFMPGVVESQQRGFRVGSFEYKKAPAMRFIGRECGEHEAKEWLLETMRALDALDDYNSDYYCDALFMHHFGLCVDVGPWRGYWGRFMRAGTPVPDGFSHFDFAATRGECEAAVGPPYISQFAYARFIGDSDAMHKSEGYDSDAMYDVTRNIILSQGTNIPYPDKYWTAEIFPDGCLKPSSEYMFGVEL